MRSSMPLLREPSGSARPQHLHRLARRAQRRGGAAPLCRRRASPTYETPEAAVAGLLHRVRYRRNQALLMETPPARPDPFEPDVAAARAVDRRCALAAGRSWLDPDEVAARACAPTAFRCRAERRDGGCRQPPPRPRRDRFSGRAENPLARHHAQIRCRRRRARSGDAERGAARGGARCSSASRRRDPRRASTAFSCSRWCGGRARSNCSSGSARTRSSGRSSCSARAAPRSRSCATARSGCRR